METLAGKKVVMIIAHKNFRDEELLTPKSILEKNGASISIASSGLSEAQGMLGAKVKPEMLVDSINSSDFDAAIFVGGGGASEYFNNPKAHKVAAEILAKGKLLAAICIASSTLANAGVLRGKKATCFKSEVANLKIKGAIYTGKPVEQDGSIITSDGPGSASMFGEAIASELAKR
jgi:protease I